MTNSENDLAARLREVHQWHVVNERVDKTLYIKAAEAIEKQQDEIRQLEDELLEKITSETYLEKVVVENGVMDIRLRGNIFHAFAESFSRVFVNSGAENYLVANFHNEELGAFTVTMQRKKGLFPEEKVAAQLVRIKDLEKALSMAAERLLELNDDTNCDTYEGCVEALRGDL